MTLLTADNVKLGFIGLGNMGSRIAQRLLANGYQVFVYDRNVAKADAIAARGGIVAKNILELAGSVDVILSCRSPISVASVGWYPTAEGIRPSSADTSAPARV